MFVAEKVLLLLVISLTDNDLFVYVQLIMLESKDPFTNMD